ncbi:MAG: hypothetical protein AMXMBFR58_29620 [Phycisphaerae bacterium]
MALTDDIIDFWPFDEGAGSVAHGRFGRVNLSLARTDQVSGEAISAAGGWTTEPGGRTSYNGGGVANLEAAGYTLLAVTGDAVTMAARIWMGGGMDVQPSYDEEATCHYMGLRGHWDIDNPPDYQGWRCYSTYGALDEVLIERSGFGLYAPASWTFTLGSPPAYSTRLLVLTLERRALDTRIRLAVDGTFKADAVLAATNFSDAARAVFGCLYYARGAVSQAAMWERVLSDGEVTTLGSDLDDLEPSDDNLTDGDGVSWLHPARITRRSVHAVLTAEGPQRHTRRAAERAPRRYSVEVPVMTKLEHAKLVAAVLATRGGLLPITWRHPTDDAAPTRYRLLNGSDVALELSREPGGAATGVTLELESV